MTYSPKPRLRLVRGRSNYWGESPLWQCGLGLTYGLGKTPLEAWQAWLNAEGWA